MASVARALWPCAPAIAETLDGIWDATVTVNNVAIPFRIELSSNGSSVQSHFFNGDDKVNPSSQGTFRDGILLLKFASYATQLSANLKDGTLSGLYEGGPGSSYPFEAKRHQTSVVPADPRIAPSINGNWRNITARG